MDLSLMISGDFGLYFFYYFGALYVVIEGFCDLKLKDDAVEKRLALDDERIETILKEHITLDDAEWNKLDLQELYFSGEEAKKIGIAHEIGEFAPPPGTQIYNV